jgi:hypothetical protein
MLYANIVKLESPLFPALANAACSLLYPIGYKNHIHTKGFVRLISQEILFGAREKR